VNSDKLIFYLDKKNNHFYFVREWNRSGVFCAAVRRVTYDLNLHAHALDGAMAHWVRGLHLKWEYPGSDAR